MAQLPLIYSPLLNDVVQQGLQKKPSLKDAYKSLEKSVVNNPRQASIEYIPLKNGKTIL
jgi:hypothetical protein